MEPSGHPWAGLAADTELLGGDRGGRARVAIASYEFVGVVRNGGIGTANTELGLALAGDGHEVDLIFTGVGDVGEAEFERWRRHYLERGVRLHRLSTPAGPTCDSVIHSAEHSLALYRTLKERDEERPYDAIHFVESLGHGFYSLLAKRAGIGFERATTVVCTHSPRRWLAEAHQMPFTHPDELSDEFLENRSLELADVVISPSAHMLDWLRDRGVRLPERSYVQQYVTDFDRVRSAPPDPAPVEELVFFGRLEPRKGILTFCDALDLLAADPPPSLRRISLLGKESVPREALLRRADAWPWQLELHTDLDRDAALSYLGAPGRLAVMASTKDNSPNVVYEAIGLGLAFLASRGGGTAELVHADDFERVTYDPEDPELTEVDPADPTRTQAVHSGRVLAEQLARALRSEPRPARFAVEPGANREAHLAWHRALAGAGAPSAAAAPAPTLPAPIEAPELPTATPAGELVLIADKEVEAEPRCGELLAAAAASSGAAFVTSLGGFDAETPNGIEPHAFLPTGGPASTGLFGNCAGAGVAVARREALERLGVLADAARGPLSVGELLSRAVLAGERVDVLPETLYRLPSVCADGSFSRTGDLVELMRPYYLGLPPEARDIAASAARLYHEEPHLRRAAAEADHLHRLYSGLVSSRGQRAIRALRSPGKALRRLRRGRGA